MSTHPSEKPRPVRASGNLLCPACGRDFGADEGWHWVSMRDHVASHPDEQHVAWRRAHPGPLERPVADEEVTLWHVLRDCHRARGELGAGGGGAGGGGAVEGDGAVRFCNRLDRGTSGIVCVATTARLADRVQACWHQASKEYLVLVRGSTEALAVERAHSSRRPASVPSQSGVLLNGSSAGLKFSAAPGILACTSARRPHLSSRSSKESAAPRHSASRRACSGLG